MPDKDKIKARAARLDAHRQQEKMFKGLCDRAKHLSTIANNLVSHREASSSHREACLQARARMHGKSPTTRAAHHQMIREHRHAAGEHALQMGEHCKGDLDKHDGVAVTIREALQLYATKHQILEPGEKVHPERRISKDTAAHEDRIKALANAWGFHASRRRLAREQEQAGG